MDKTAITIQSFDATANAYARRFADCSAYAPALNEFCTLLPRGARVLDVGCGPGNVARFLLDSRPDLRVTGIDLSPAMVHHFRDVVPEATAQVEDIRHLERLDSEFDALVASFCLPFLTHEEASDFIETLAQLSCVGAPLYLATMQGEGQGLEKTSFGGQRDFFFNYYARTFIDALLDAKGFEVLAYREQLYPQEQAPDLVDMIYLCRRAAHSSE
jgi:cyclopropane fatty-acyl-phospholipid synthase-like methyltransferase